jgi:DHA1 family multidrug resistance protein-like MFS transporter
MIYNTLLLGYWFLWTQITLAIPLRAVALAGTDSAVSWVYSVNAVLSIALQYPLMRFADKRFAPAVTLLLGVGLLTTSLGLIGVASNIYFLLGCVAVYSLGGLFAAPSQQTIAANLADNSALGSYFGVAGLAIALGGGMGSFSGGTLYGWGQAINQPAAPWLVFAGVGSITTLLLFLFFRANHLLRRAVA